MNRLVLYHRVPMELAVKKTFARLVQQNKARNPHEALCDAICIYYSKPEHVELAETAAKIVALIKVSPHQFDELAHLGAYLQLADRNYRAKTPYCKHQLPSRDTILGELLALLASPEGGWALASPDLLAVCYPSLWYDSVRYYNIGLIRVPLSIPTPRAPHLCNPTINGLMRALPFSESRAFDIATKMYDHARSALTADLVKCARVCRVTLPQN